MNEKVKHIVSKDGFHWLIYYILLATKTARFVPDKWYVKLEYRCLMGKRLDLKHPQTFNEKLQWLKIYDRRPEYTTMVDKYAVKQYVADRIGAEYIIPTLGVWDRPELIEWDGLPDKFVLKCTHNSGGLVICKDKKKLDKDAAIKKLSGALERDYYLASREWPYKNVPRRIIAEQYLEDATIEDLRDYKFFCFNGKMRVFKIDFDRQTDHKANYFDRNGKLLPYGEKVCPPQKDKQLEIPQNFEEMIKVVEKLSEALPFGRIDFYNVNGKIYFGEITLFPAGGFGAFTDEKFDYELGGYIQLPTNK